MRLGRHFDSGEFNASDGTPFPATALPELERLVRDVLQPMRSRFGRCTVTSGYRTAALNRRAGGAARSFHRYDLAPGRGVAADVVFATGDPVAWSEMAMRLGAGGVGRYRSFVHVDTRRAPARWSG